MHKFFHFAHLKSTFSILHIYFYKTPISVCLFYTFIQIKYLFLYPHSHRPTPINTSVSHWTPHNLPAENQKNKPSNKIDAPRINTTQQHNPHNPPGIDASPWATRSTPSVAMARTRNKIDASKGKRWRWRWRWRETFNPIQPETHWSSPFNPKTTRNKGRKSDRRRWRSTEARGRKIDQMRGRKKELCAWERERGS